MDYTIDAKDKILGRLASEVAVILQGKKNPDYEPRLVGRDRVLLANYRQVKLSGDKARQKTYYRHTGYMGHLKSATFEQAFAKNPKAVIRSAVERMLPKNFLQAKRIKNLIFVEK